MTADIFIGNQSGKWIGLKNLQVVAVPGTLRAQLEQNHENLATRTKKPCPGNLETK